MLPGVKSQPELTNRLSSYNTVLQELKHETEQLRSSGFSKGSQSALVHSSAIANLQHQNDSYVLKVQEEQAAIQRLEEQIKVVSQQIAACRRKNQSKAEEHQKKHADLQKLLKGLENKIEKDRQIYNQSVAYNAALKEKVNSLRREKVLFGNMYRQLTNEVESKKEEIEVLKQKTKRAMKERDANVKQVSALKHSEEKQKAEFKTYWKTLEETIKQENHFDQFTTSVTIEQHEEFPMTPQVPTTLEEQRLFECKEKLKTYNRELNKLFEATQIQDLKQLVAKFLEQDSQNFSIFSHVSQLSSEMERLEAQNADTRAKIQGLQLHTPDLDRQEEMDLLRTRFKGAKHLKKTLKEMHEEARKTSDIVAGGVQEMLELLGQPMEVDDRNLVECFEVVEKAFNQYFSSRLPTEKGVGNRSAPLKIEQEVPPVDEKVVLEDPELVFPLPVDELRYRALEQLMTEQVKKPRKNR